MLPVMIVAKVELSDQAGDRTIILAFFNNGVYYKSCLISMIPETVADNSLLK